MALHVLQDVGRERLGVHPHRADEVVGRLPVAELVDVAAQVVLGVALGVALHDVGVAPHLQLAAVLLARQPAVVVHAGAHAVGVVRVGDDEGDVALLGGEVPAGLRAARVHDHGVGLLQRMGAADAPSTL